MGLGPTHRVFASPPNDSISGATVVTGLPFTDTADVGAATADPSDPQDCNYGPTVWHTYSPTVDTAITLDAFGSDFAAGFIAVYSGGPGALQFLGCFDVYQPNSFQTVAGTSYYFMVSYINFDCQTCGNTLQFNVDKLTPVDIGFTLDPTASFDSKTGVVTLHGTVTCDADIHVVYIDGQVQQKVGRQLISGWFNGTADCPAETATWTASVSSPTGIFKGGPATVQMSGVGCDQYTCDFVPINTQVKLSSSGKR